jgi:hypothetical protein
MLNKNNKLLQAALDYATDGRWPLKVFPAPPGEKKSHYSMKFTEDGARWGATKTPELIEKYWRENPDANIGIPTGAENGFFVVEVDRREAHEKLTVDGQQSLAKLIADNGGEWPKTRIVRSPTNSLHYYFAQPLGFKSRNSASALGEGIDVRGDGGMVIAPPSINPKYPGKCYEVVDPSPIDLPPDWLLELVREKSRVKSKSQSRKSQDDDALAPIEKLAAAMEVIPNDHAGVVWQYVNHDTDEFDKETGWDGWCKIGMALYRASGGSDEGFAIFDKWSAKNKAKYNENNTHERWYKKFASSPPDRVGAATIFHLADLEQSGWQLEQDHGWQPTPPNDPPPSTPQRPPPPPNDPPKTPPPSPSSSSSPNKLDEVHKTFSKHFGTTFDLDALDIMLAVAASQKLDGDPVWLLIVSGSGAAKTELVQTLGGAGAHVTSTIASEGALLSGARKKVKNATGGLLRKIGSEGMLVIKDVTSILSNTKESRAAVLAALREVYDGRWERNVGADGGQTLTWIGRITVLGAVTTAWDAHHAVVTVMGDRFLLVRVDSEDKDTRLASGRRAIDNTGSEIGMRQELAAAVGAVLANVQGCSLKLSEDEKTKLLNAADIVTRSRTAVELDYMRNVIDSHAPEMPTRFAKQLVQVVRGCVALGIDREKAMKLAIRCARNSMPPLRSLILCDVALHPGTTVGQTRKRIGKPWQTTKRMMDALTMLKLLECDEVEVTDSADASYDESKKEDRRRKWLYQLADGIDRTALLSMAGVADVVAEF